MDGLNCLDVVSRCGVFKQILKIKNVSFALQITYERAHFEGTLTEELEIPLEIDNTRQDILIFKTTDPVELKDTNNAICTISLKHQEKVYYVTDFMLVKMSKNNNYQCINGGDPNVLLNYEEIHQLTRPDYMFSSITVNNNIVHFVPSTKKLNEICLQNKFSDPACTPTTTVLLIIVLVLALYIFFK